SSPRSAAARTFRAAARACSAPSVSAEPTLMRGLRPPWRYWTVHERMTRLPSWLRRKRSPKRGSSSSQEMCSFLPAGMVSARASFAVSFTFEFLSQALGEAPGRRSAASPWPLLSLLRAQAHARAGLVKHVKDLGLGDAQARAPRIGGGDASGEGSELDSGLCE